MTGPGELLGGGWLPGLRLAADRVEADARVVGEQAAEGVAGADRLEPVGIAEQDDLGAAIPGVGEDAAEPPHVERSRLVEEKHGARMETLGALRPGALEARERAGRDAGLGLQRRRGFGGQGRAADLVAVLLVGGGDGTCNRNPVVAGAVAADDLAEIGGRRGVKDGGALLGGELIRSSRTRPRCSGRRRWPVP